MNNKMGWDKLDSMLCCNSDELLFKQNLLFSEVVPPQNSSRRV
jgi:hypothetical protein